MVCPRTRCSKSGPRSTSDDSARSRPRVVPKERTTDCLSTSSRGNGGSTVAARSRSCGCTGPGSHLRHGRAHSAVTTTECVGAAIDAAGLAAGETDVGEAVVGRVARSRSSDVCEYRIWVALPIPRVLEHRESVVRGQPICAGRSRSACAARRARAAGSSSRAARTPRTAAHERDRVDRHVGSVAQWTCVKASGTDVVDDSRFGSVLAKSQITRSVRVRCVRDRAMLRPPGSPARSRRRNINVTPQRAAVICKPTRSSGVNRSGPQV